ncbi:MAG: HPF/RaiA family ribosome-associated protein [Acidobacteria bacterium]|nr:HPF/RaiA family ribosome-associated protein [Acidobacteriota bacterium]
MNLKIQHRNLQIPKTLEELIEKKSRKVQRVLPTFASQDLHLHVSLEKLPRGRQYRTVVVLNLPQSAIRVEDIEVNASHSVLRAFGELLRRIKRFKSQLNREKFWQQRVLIPAASAVDETQEIENAINQSLDKVENYIRRELYHQVLMGNFPAGLVQPQAVLDEVFLEVRSRVTSKPPNWTVEQWMIQIARDKLQKRAQDLEVSREETHVEEAAENVPRWEDEPLNFYQPDEVLRVEDLLPSENSVTPEELLAQHEREEQLQEAIAQLPDSIRESFVLFALEGFNSDEIAMITRKTQGRVLEEVQEAQSLLRQKFNVGRQRQVHN